MKHLSHKEFSSKGGLTRAEKLSEEERKKIASMGGVAARGKPRKPRTPRKKKKTPASAPTKEGTD